MNPIIGSKADPIASFGRDAAAVITTTLKRIPAADRKRALQAWLNAISPTLSTEVETRAMKVQVQTVNAPAALQYGLRVALSNAMVHGIIDAGSGDMDALQGLLGCSCGGPSAAGDIFDHIDAPYPAITSGVKAVERLAYATVRNPQAAKIANLVGEYAGTYYGGNPAANGAAAQRGIKVLAARQAMGACSMDGYEAVGFDLYGDTIGKLVDGAKDLGEAAYEAVIKPALGMVLNKIKSGQCAALTNPTTRATLVASARASAAAACLSVGIPPNPITDKIADKIINAAINAQIALWKCPTVTVTVPDANTVFNRRVFATDAIAAQLNQPQTFTSTAGPSKGLLLAGAAAAAALFLL